MQVIRYKGWMLGALWLLLALLLLLVSPAAALEIHDLDDADTTPGVSFSLSSDLTPTDTAATSRHWRLARRYQKAMRLELARQEYLMALAHCRTEKTRDRLQRELQTVDLQLRTLR